MNRETKRMMQRHEQLQDQEPEAEGLAAVAATRPASDRVERKRTGTRHSPMQFLREVRDELRQVAWPSRVEMVNYSMVVLFTLVLMVLLIFGLNFVFGKAVLFMFQK